MTEISKEEHETLTGSAAYRKELKKVAFEASLNKKTAHFLSMLLGIKEEDLVEELTKEQAEHLQRKKVLQDAIDTKQRTFGDIGTLLWEQKDGQGLGL